MPAETWKGNNKKNNQNVKIHFSFFYRKYHTITSFCIVLLDVSWLLSLFTFSSTQVGLRHIYIVNLYFRKRSIYISLHEHSVYFPALIKNKKYNKLQLNFAGCLLMAFLMLAILRVANTGTYCLYLIKILNDCRAGMKSRGNG